MAKSFTDTLSSRPVSFRDNMNFITGSLGYDVAIFASDIMEDDVIDNDGIIPSYSPEIPALFPQSI